MVEPSGAPLFFTKELSVLVLLEWFAG